MDMNLNMNTDMKEPAVQLIAMLGQPYHPKRVQALLKPYGVKRMPAPKSYFNDTMISCAKSISKDGSLPYTQKSMS
ncbi:hypothetical protein ACFTAO_27410 [Paenibacillus rhizoplanae]